MPPSRPRELVLVVDDDPVVRTRLRTNLEQAGYRVAEAENGHEALQSVTGEPPVLVIMDLMLPGTDGIDLMQELRHVHECAHVPVLILTAVEDSDEHVRALQSGAVDFITKPVAPAALVARTATHIEMYRLQMRLRHRSRVEAVIREITLRFIELTTDEIDAGVNDALARLTELFGTDRTYIFQFSSDMETMSNTYERCAPGISSQMDELQDVPRNTVPWWMANIDRRKLVYIEDVDSLPEEAAAEREILSRQGIQSLLVVPIERRSSLEGFVGFDSVRNHRIWTEDEQELLRSFASSLMVLLHRRRVETQLERTRAELDAKRREELETSARIQRDILIQDPDFPPDRVDAYALTIPSQQVDGDFYAFFQFQPRVYDVLVADVMGKGITGAFWGAAIKSQFLHEALSARCPDEHLPAVDALVNAVSRNVTDTLLDLSSFTTLFYARFSERQGRVDFVDAGHTPVVHVEAASGRCWMLKGRNVPLGFIPDEEYRSLTVPYAPGDLFLFYSDGLVEATNPQDEQYGERRLIAALQSSGDRPAAEVVAAVREDVLAFSQDSGIDDDLTVLAMRLSGTGTHPGSRETRSYPPETESLPAIREDVDRSLTRYYGDRLSSRQRDRARLAVNEGASNALHHGMARVGARAGAGERAMDGEAEGGSPTPDLEVEVGMYPSWFYLRLVYPGPYFRWASVEQPDIRTMAERGYGMYLMQHSMDSVSYAYDLQGRMMLTLAAAVGDEGHTGVTQ